MSRSHWRQAGCALLLACTATSLQAQRKKPPTRLPPPITVPVKQPAPEPKPVVPATMEVPAFTQAARRDLCPPEVLQLWDTLGQEYANEAIKSGGAIACSSNPSRPVILLFHGVHQNKTTWTAPSYVDFAYDYNNHPPRERIGDTHSDQPPTPVYVGRSNWLYGSEDNRAKWDRDVNWFDYLRNQNFTVATWSQDTMLIKDAMPSARAAFDSFLAYTASRNPAAPPPVAIVAHSRGGLVARQLLKERGGLGRVKWVITIHSPHQGSQLGKYPNELGLELVQFIDHEFPGNLPPAIRDSLKKLAVTSLEPLTRWIMTGEEQELYPGSNFFDALTPGEGPIADAKYYTFGGTNPRVFRMYLKNYTLDSFTPQCCKDGREYYVWRVDATELPLSPILDAVRDFVPEVKPDYGDSLVALESTKLPWSTQHFATKLNHAEVLWNRELQKQIVDLIK